MAQRAACGNSPPATFVSQPGLTGENLEAPWIMFEAGALSKNLEKAKVCPILFGPDPTDITGPLVQFQAAPFDRKEIKRVVTMINKELGDQALASAVLDSVFEMWWPRLDEQVQTILAKKSDSTAEKRSDRDVLEEILALTRVVSRGRVSGERLSPMAAADLVSNYAALVDLVIANDLEDILGTVVERLSRPINHIGRMRPASVESGALLEQTMGLVNVHFRQSLPEDAPVS